MKRLTFLLFLFPILLTGQVVKDTIIQSGGAFFREVTTQEGNDVIIRRRFLDSTQAGAVQVLLREIDPQVNTYARQGVVFARRSELDATVTNLNTLITQATGASLWQLTNDTRGDELLGNYRYRRGRGGNVVELTSSIIRLAGGGMRIRIDGVNFNMRILNRNYIILLAHDNRAEIPLFYDDKNLEYISPDGWYRLRKL